MGNNEMMEVLAIANLKRKAEIQRTKKESETTVRYLPPYFMTITEAVEFILAEGYEILNKSDQHPIQNRYIAAWEEEIRKASENET